MPHARIAVIAASVLLGSLVIVGGLIIAAVQVAMAVDWQVPEPVEAGQPTEVYDRDGERLATFAAEVERQPVEFDGIAPSLRDAVVAKEDHRFWQHRGVDTLSVLRAVWQNVRTGSIVEGGSTLTQQYVKNAYLGADRTFTRKAKEAMIALQLEKERSKEEILTSYLNRVYFGDGAYGAEAAARNYFGKSADELELHESATLASVLSAPTEYSPRNDPSGALARRDQVLDKMAQHGFAEPGAVARAQQAQLGLVPPSDDVRAAPHFVAAVRQQLLDAYGPERVYYGGLRVTTTLDLDQQRTLVEQIQQHLPSDTAIDAGAVAMDHRTGDILAIYPGRLGFQESEVNLAMDFGRPTGSAFKPIVLATALQGGRELSSTVPAPSEVTIEDWTVTGSRCAAPCTLLEATVNSSNTGFANLASQVGLDRFTDMGHLLGVRAEFSDHNLSQALGTASLTPLDLTSAFATFANEGVACPARTVLTVQTPEGQELDPPSPRQPTEEQLEAWGEHFPRAGRVMHSTSGPGNCHQAVTRSVAHDVTTALQGVVARGTGTNAQIPRPQAGKTGTTDDARELWFAGYTPKLSLGIFVGARESNRPLRNLPGCGGSCVGGDIPARMWASAAGELLADVEPGEFAASAEAGPLTPAPAAPTSTPAPGGAFGSEESEGDDALAPTTPTPPPEGGASGDDGQADYGVDVPEPGQTPADPGEPDGAGEPEPGDPGDPGSDGDDSDYGVDVPEPDQDQPGSGQPDGDTSPDGGDDGDDDGGLLDLS